MLLRTRQPCRPTTFAVPHHQAKGGALHTPAQYQKQRFLRAQQTPVAAAVVQVRRAEAKDLNALVRLELACGGYYSRQSLQARPELKSPRVPGKHPEAPLLAVGQQEELDSGVATVLVSEDVGGHLHPRGTVLGLGIAWLVGDEVQILELAVHRLGRRRGIATRLVRELIQRCWDERPAGLKPVQAVLECHAQNDAALMLYRQLGFVQVGERRGYYPHDGGTAILMRFTL